MPVASSDPAAAAEIQAFYRSVVSAPSAPQILSAVRSFNGPALAAQGGSFNGLADEPALLAAARASTDQASILKPLPTPAELAALSSTLASTAASIGAKAILVQGDDFRSSQAGSIDSALRFISSSIPSAGPAFALGARFQFGSASIQGLGGTGIHLVDRPGAPGLIIAPSGKPGALLHEYAHMLDSLSANPAPSALSKLRSIVSVASAASKLGVPISDLPELSSKTAYEVRGAPRATMGSGFAKPGLRDDILSVQSALDASGYSKKSFSCDSAAKAKGRIDAPYYQDSSEAFARAVEASFNGSASSCSPDLSPEQAASIRTSVASIASKLAARRNDSDLAAAPAQPHDPKASKP